MANFGVTDTDITLSKYTNCIHLQTPTHTHDSKYRGSLTCSCDKSEERLRQQTPTSFSEKVSSPSHYRHSHYFLRRCSPQPQSTYKRQLVQKIENINEILTATSQLHESAQVHPHSWGLSPTGHLVFRRIITRHKTLDLTVGVGKEHVKWWTGVTKVHYCQGSVVYALVFGTVLYFNYMTKRKPRSNSAGKAHLKNMRSEPTHDIQH